MFSLPYILHRNRIIHAQRMICNRGLYFRLKYLQEMKQMGQIKWLFEAKFNREDVIVKFCRFHYAYSYLAGHQLAPQLKYNMGILPSKWLIVVMEKIQGSHLQIPVSEEVKMMLWHDEGYVHEDLRLQNILVVNKIIHILDFDWAGVKGEARYP